MADFIRRVLLKWSKPVIVVSGLPRSGTSMAMKMLDAGGAQLYIDNVRKPDEDNPKGYFELERVKRLREEPDKSWVKEARGKALKVISYLLTDLPGDNRYKVVFMHRHPDEMIASQNRMLERRGEPLAQNDAEVVRFFQRHLSQVKAWLSRRANFEVLELQYTEVVSNPVKAAESIRSFLQLDLDVARMAEAVDPSLHRNRAPES